MSQDEVPAARPPRRPLLIENVFEKETTESFVEQAFRKGPLHRAKDAGEFDVGAMAREFGASLVRSTQELVPKASGRGHVSQWVSLVFHRPGDVFWHVIAKSGTYGNNETDRSFTLTVTSADPEVSARDALMLRKRFIPDDSSPGFFFLKDIRNPRRMPLRSEYLLSREALALHYGENFPAWADRFASGLGQNGLSILRGRPGTGKTSFLRHLILLLAETHRFYYVPVDSFSLLHGGLTEFLARERARCPEAVLVIVLEDAEQLLLDRRGHRDGLASTLLNFTDGFIGDLVSAHLICTVNSEARELDEAVLRPGRQRFFHEFDLLPRDQARRLAESLGITLTESRSYSLAEIYHFADLLSEDRLNTGKPRAIGFVS